AQRPESRTVIRNGTTYEMDVPKIGRDEEDTDRSDRAVFPWTRECGRCPRRVQESRARSRTTRSTLIWEIPTQKSYRACWRVSRLPRNSGLCQAEDEQARVANRVHIIVRHGHRPGG